MNFEKFKKFRKIPVVISLSILNSKVSRCLNDHLFLKIKYRLIMGKKLNLENPESFNEKIQWLKINDRKPIYTMLVDKYEVRKYVAEKIGDDYLVPIIGVWRKFDDIDFEMLPERFVLKPNHTSGNIYICKNKKLIDMFSLRNQVNSWMKRQYYWYHREWPYKNIEPRIICEELLEDETGEGLKDYKFLCFSGKVRCSFVCLNRYSKGGLNIDFYDMNWNKMNFERHYPNSNSLVPRPYNYDKMIEFAEKLSYGITFVRVDFYESKGKLYFGELTFHPGSGYEEFNPESYDYLLGSWINLK